MSGAILVEEVPSDIHVVPCPCGHGSDDIVIGNAFSSRGCIATAAANHTVHEALGARWLGLKVVDRSGHPLVGATVRVYVGSTVSTAMVGACGFMRIDGLHKGGCYDIEVDDRPNSVER